MTNPDYLQEGFEKLLAHAIEECGEFLAAAGKTQRWGRYSVDPTIPPEEQEVNLEWLTREAFDVRETIDRLLDNIRVGDPAIHDKAESQSGGRQ